MVPTTLLLVQSWKGISLSTPLFVPFHPCVVVCLVNPLFHLIFSLLVCSPLCNPTPTPALTRRGLVKVEVDRDSVD